MGNEASTPEPAAPAELFAERRTLLKPWLNVLRNTLEFADVPPLPTVSDIRNLRLKISAPLGRRSNNTSVMWLLIMEAMELMDLLARVDEKAAWCLLLELARRKEFALQYADVLFGSSVDPLLPKFTISIHDKAFYDPEQTTAQSLMRMLVKNTGLASSTYAHAKQTLLAEWAEKNGGETFDRSTHGRVKVMLVFIVLRRSRDPFDMTVTFDQLFDLAHAELDPSTIELNIKTPNVIHEPEEADDDDEVKSIDSNQDDEGDEEDGDDDNDLGQDGWATAVVVAVPRPATQHERGSFEFDEFRINWATGSPMTPPVLHLINEISKTGIRVSFEGFPGLDLSELLHSQVSFFLRNHLALSHDPHGQPAQPRVARGAETFSILMEKLDADAVRLVCSALAHSQSVRTVRVFGVHLQPAASVLRDLWLPWSIYALFSGEADHNIEVASIDVQDLEDHHVRKVREMLAHSNPLAFLYEADRPGRAPNELIQVEAMAMRATFDSSTSFHVGYYGSPNKDPISSRLPLRDQSPHASYQVVRNRDDEDFVEVLVPGTGVCWAKRSAVRELEPVPRREKLSIRHLRIPTLVSGETEVIDLLQLIGEPIEELTLDDAEDPIDAEMCMGLLACCPNLKRLNIGAIQLENLEWLEGWALNHPNQLETISLSCVSMDVDRGWCPFFDGLADSTRALTKSLKNLHVNAGWFTDPDDDDPESHPPAFDACLRMLDANVLLERFELLSLHETLKDVYLDKFLSHNKPIAGERIPLPQCETLAFLSVCTSSGATEPLQKQRKNDESNERRQSIASQLQLDQNSLQIILAFAAEPKRRSCAVY